MGHVGPRHHLCPGCGYDLVATLAAHGRRCPECGYEFEMHELVPETREGDWTPWRGVRSASRVLLVKGALGAAAWALVLTLNHHLALSGFPRLLVGLAVLATGAAVGWVLAHRIDEHLGFAGLGVAAALTCFAMLVLGLGTTIAIQVGGVRSSDTMLALLVSCLASAGFITKKAFLDDQ